MAVLTLALGIAANSTIFSWISATLLNPIPGVAHTSDLVTVMRGDRSDHPTPPFSYLDLRDFSERNQSFSGLLGYHDDYMSLTGAAKPERIYGALTTANYFDVPASTRSSAAVFFRKKNAARRRCSDRHRL